MNIDLRLYSSSISPVKILSEFCLFEGFVGVLARCCFEQIYRHALDRYVVFLARKEQVRNM